MSQWFQKEKFDRSRNKEKFNELLSAPLLFSKDARIQGNNCAKGVQKNSISLFIIRLNSDNKFTEGTIIISRATGDDRSSRRAIKESNPSFADVARLVAKELNLRMPSRDGRDYLRL